MRTGFREAAYISAFICCERRKASIWSANNYEFIKRTLCAVGLRKEWPAKAAFEGAGLITAYKKDRGVSADSGT